MLDHSWNTILLSESCTKIGSGFTPKGGSKRYLSQGPVALIRSQNIHNQGFSKSGLAYISMDDANAMSGVTVEKGDVLLNITGDSVARCCLIPDQILPARVNQHVMIIRPKDRLLNSKFLKYFLIAQATQTYLLQLAGAGATRPALTKQMVESLRVPHPPLRDQASIAHILGTLDDKIELNRKMNETLEAIAQALFQSWFVDFDPVIDKALAAGNRIPEPLQERAAARQALGNQQKPLPEDIAQLFPDEFVESELGWIPMNWQISSIYELVEIHYGAPFSSELFNTLGKGMPLIRIRDLKTCMPGLWTEEIHPKGTLILPGEIIVGMDAEFKAHMWLGREALLNQRLFLAKPKFDFISNYYIKQALAPLLYNEERSQVGTTVAHIGKKDIDKFKILNPGVLILKFFKQKCEPILERLICQSKESIVLRSLRDTLLPKLISGEIRIPDAEKLLAEVT